MHLPGDFKTFKILGKYHVINHVPKEVLYEYLGVVLVTVL